MFIFCVICTLRANSDDQYAALHTTADSVSTMLTINLHLQHTSPQFTERIELKRQKSNERMQRRNPMSSRSNNNNT
jgi:hypothetical protein